MSVSGLAHLLLGAFLLQRLELPVLLFGDEDPAALNVRHRLKRERREEKSGVNIQAKLKGGEERTGGREGGEGGGCHSRLFFFLFKNVNSIMSANNHTKTCKHTLKETQPSCCYIFDFNPLQTFGGLRRAGSNERGEKKKKSRASERTRGEVQGWGSGRMQRHCWQTKRGPGWGEC